MYSEDFALPKVRDIESFLRGSRNLAFTFFE